MYTLQWHGTQCQIKGGDGCMLTATGYMGCAMLQCSVGSLESVLAINGPGRERERAGARERAERSARETEPEQSTHPRVGLQLGGHEHEAQESKLNSARGERPPPLFPHAEPWCFGHGLPSGRMPPCFLRQVTVCTIHRILPCFRLSLGPSGNRHVRSPTSCNCSPWPRCLPPQTLSLSRSCCVGPLSTRRLFLSSCSSHLQ